MYRYLRDDFSTKWRNMAAIFDFGVFVIFHAACDLETVG